MSKSSITMPSTPSFSTELPLTEFIKQVLSDFDITCPDEINLTGCQGDLTNDSRSIADSAGTGDIFCAIIGHEQDGRQYIESAINSGAKLVLSECKNESEHGDISYVDVKNNVDASA